jgi:hypothetical protein
MIKTCLAAMLSLLLAGAAYAETAQLMKNPPTMPDAAFQKRVCYFNAGGFIYHYVIDRGLVTRPCVDSIETPFAPVPSRWAVLIKDEVEAHENPWRLCYYGLAYGRVEVERISPDKSCRWTAGLEYVPPSPSTGTAVLNHEEDAETGTNAKLCLYRLTGASHTVRFTHYVIISKYSKCLKTFPAY